MKYKCFTIGIILLFVGTAVIPTSGQNLEKASLPMSRGNIIYVGGSGPGNYTKIQDAIDNASDGDVVYVFPGIFKERIEINKSIHLQGSDLRTTVIDGQGTNTDIVTCVGTNAVITGFTIHNSSINHSCILINHTSNCTIQENIIHRAGYGFTLRKVQNISIINNTFCQNLTTNAGYIGITVDNCIFITLSKNRISSWDSGMLIHGTHLLITQNTIINTHRGITDTLNSLPWTNKYLTIGGNYLNRNKEGIYLAGSSDYSITHNEITNSSVVGVYLAENAYVSVSPENIAIKENIITTSAQGIYSEHSINLSIEENHIQFNTLGVLFIYDSFTSVKRNTFQHNNKTVVYYWAFFPRSRIHNKVPQFDLNFWDQPQESPYRIVGRWGVIEPSFFFNPKNIFPWVTFDWHPAQEPYNISRMS